MNKQDNTSEHSNETRRVLPHWFEVFEGEDANNESTWCKHCNTTRTEIEGLHQ